MSDIVSVVMTHFCSVSPGAGKTKHNLATCIGAMEYFVFEQHVLFLSVTLDHRFQCPRVGLGVKIYGIFDYFHLAFIFLAGNQSTGTN